MHILSLSFWLPTRLQPNRLNIWTRVCVCICCGVSKKTLNCQKISGISVDLANGTSVVDVVHSLPHRIIRNACQRQRCIRSRWDFWFLIFFLIWRSQFGWRRNVFLQRKFFSLIHNLTYFFSFFLWNIWVRPKRLSLTHFVVAYFGCDMVRMDKNFLSVCMCANHSKGTCFAKEIFSLLRDRWYFFFWRLSKCGEKWQQQQPKRESPFFCYSDFNFNFGFCCLTGNKTPKPFSQQQVNKKEATKKEHRLEFVTSDKRVSCF